ncbi:MAG: hypothetical protein C5B60_07205 [Chloroflexi bacterium]|nr:MAG: hypothetical protein C5B60_07205 [Chloroflexota bacterium]
MDRLFNNLKHVLSANVITGLVNFLSTVWFARKLGPEIMGQFAVLLVVIQMLTAFLTPGFNQAIIRNPSRNTLATAATFATFLQSLVMIGASAILYGMVYWVSNQHVANLLLPGIGMLASAVMSLWMYLLAVPFEAGLDYRSLVYIRIVALMVSIVTGVLAVEAGFGLYALVIRDLVFSLASLIILRSKSPFPLIWEGWREGISPLFRFARGLWPLNILERLVLRLDYAMVGLLFDIETLGIYFAVRGIVEGALGFTLSPIQTVLYAYYCRLPNINVVSITILRKDLLLLVGLATTAVIAVLHVTGDWIVATTLGIQYSRGYVLLDGLVLYAVSVAWFEHIKVLTMSQDNHHSMMLARMVQLMLSVALVFPLVRYLGLMGAGLSAGIAAAAMAGLSMWILAKAFPIGTGDFRPDSVIVHS